MLGDKLETDKEIEFLADIFSSDAKNYHAWSYRIWLVERFQLWDGELDFVEELLDDDVTNNSVWSYRYFILNRSPVGAFSGHKPGTVEFVQSEIDIMINKRIPQRYGNEATWVYLRGMLANTEEEAKYSQEKQVKRVFIGHFADQLRAFVTEIIEKTEPGNEEFTGVRFAQTLLLDLLLVASEKEKAIALLETLRDKTDKIRRNYWQWRINKVNA